MIIEKATSKLWVTLDELVKGLTPEKAHTDLVSTQLESEIPDYE